MMNVMEASVVMIIRLVQVSKLLLMALSIMLLIQLLIYQLSNKKINLYKKLLKVKNYFLEI